MSKIDVDADKGRRRFLAGVTAGAAGVAAYSALGSRPAEAKIGNVESTPITDTLNENEIKMLTPKAKELTEKQVILHNWSQHGYGSTPVPEVSDEDVKSLERAFISRNKRLWGLETTASLAPGMVNSAQAGASCCCSPASCCCAAVDSKPVRTRRVIV